MAVQKHSTNLTASMTSAAVGTALLALGLAQMPRPCGAQGSPATGCIAR